MRVLPHNHTPHQDHFCILAKTHGSTDPIIILQIVYKYPDNNTGSIVVISVVKPFFVFHRKPTVFWHISSLFINSVNCASDPIDQILRGKMVWNSIFIQIWKLKIYPISNDKDGSKSNLFQPSSTKNIQNQLWEISLVKGFPKILRACLNFPKFLVLILLNFFDKIIQYSITPATYV
jgi:hypothetical protein